MKLRVPPTVDQYLLFLSSSDQPEMRRLRRRVKALVEDVVAPQLREFPQARVTLAVEMWERTAPRKAPKGGTVNAHFVERAKASALTVVMILDELRDGTREELQAALGEEDVELAVLSFAPSKRTSAKKLAKLDKELRDLREYVLYSRCKKGPDSEAAWLALMRVVTYFTISALYSSELGWLGTSPEVR